MEQIFYNSKVKVERAKKHIIELEALLYDHERKNPPISTFVPGKDTTGPKIHVQSIALPIEFGAIVGDVVNNLSASLDLMAVELVRLSSPPKNPNRVRFPFSDDLPKLPAAIRSSHFNRAGADAVALLERLEPYTGGNVPLRGLHDLDNSDKRSRLIPIVITTTTGMLQINTDSFPNLVVEMVEGSSPEMKTVFPEDWAFAHHEIIPTLHDLVKLVESILQSFTHLVAARA